MPATMKLDYYLEVSSRGHFLQVGVMTGPRQVGGLGRTSAECKSICPTSERHSESHELGFPTDTPPTSEIER